MGGLPQALIQDVSPRVSKKCRSQANRVPRAGAGRPPLFRCRCLSLSSAFRINWGFLPSLNGRCVGWSVPLVAEPSPIGMVSKVVVSFCEGPEVQIHRPPAVRQANFSIAPRTSPRTPSHARDARIRIASARPSSIPADRRHVWTELTLFASSQTAACCSVCVECVA